MRPEIVAVGSLVQMVGSARLANGTDGPWLVYRNDGSSWTILPGQAGVVLDGPHAVQPYPRMRYGARLDEAVVDVWFTSGLLEQCPVEFLQALAPAG